MQPGLFWHPAVAGAGGRGRRSFRGRHLPEEAGAVVPWQVGVGAEGVGCASFRGRRDPGYMAARAAVAAGAGAGDEGRERRFFMGRCHYCINCGLCRGEKPKAILVPVCIRCGHKNPLGSETCEACGESLRLQPGVTNTANRGGFSTR